MSIEAMKQALEDLDSDDPSIQLRAAVALRQAIEQVEKQEPVAWIVDGEIRVRLDMAGKLYYSETNVYAAPVPAHTDHPMRHWDRTCPACVYESDISQERVDETAKSKHELVGLTQAEFEETVDGLEDLEDCWQAIEAKLKEKNCSAANNY
jgi:hypothetical protein